MEVYEPHDKKKEASYTELSSGFGDYCFVDSSSRVRQQNLVIEALGYGIFSTMHNCY
jgi:hypothetical protein